MSIHAAIARLLDNAFLCSAAKRPKCHSGITEADMTPSITCDKDVVHHGVPLDASKLGLNLKSTLGSSHSTVDSAIVKHYTAIVAKREVRMAAVNA